MKVMLRTVQVRRTEDMHTEKIKEEKSEGLYVRTNPSSYYVTKKKTAEHVNLYVLLQII